MYVFTCSSQCPAPLTTVDRAEALMVKAGVAAVDAKYLLAALSPCDFIVFSPGTRRMMFVLSGSLKKRWYHVIPVCGIGRQPGMLQLCAAGLSSQMCWSRSEVDRQLAGNRMWMSVCVACWFSAIPSPIFALSSSRHRSRDRILLPSKGRVGLAFLYRHK